MNHSYEFERTSLCFRADQLQRLRTISKKTGVPIAFMVRQGVDHYLDGHRLPPANQGLPGEVTTERSR